VTTADRKIKKPFDPSQITHVYHIGAGHRYGRSNNRLISILHAVDMAMDNHGGDDGNIHAIVAISGWAERLLREFFFTPRDGSPWELELEKLDPVLIVHENRLEALGLTAANGTTIVEVTAENSYWYGANTWNKMTVEKLWKRRNLVLGQLFQNVAARNLVAFHKLKEYLAEELKQKYNGAEDDDGIIKYAVIHSRWLEGQCEDRLGAQLPTHECWMTPQYVKEIVGTPVKYPIVFITDGQNEKVLPMLRDDPDIGPHLIVPKELPSLRRLYSHFQQPISDMVIAINSEIFIGTRISTMAKIVGITRVILGADPATNYVYTQEGEEEGTWEVCEDCIFLCDYSKSNLCGEEAVYA
jgi:hypothetical protein